MKLTSRRKPHKQDTFPLATLARPSSSRPLITAAGGKVGRDRSKHPGERGKFRLMLYLHAPLRKERRVINENLIGRRAAAPPVRVED